MTKLLELNKIKKSINHKNTITPILKDISFNINYGEAIAVIGTSEKVFTTLLYIAAGIDNDYKGTIKINSKTKDNKYYKILFMDSKNYFFQWRTVFENILLFLKIYSENDINRRNMEKYIMHSLENYQLVDYKDKYPSQLSGSIKSKITLIQYILTQPDLLVINNAFSNINYKTKTELLYILRNSFLSEENSVLFSTQNIDDIMSLADKAVILSPTPASVKTILKLDKLDNKRNLKKIKENPAYAEYSDNIMNNLEYE